ncbi:MAG: purine-nucleoside phosphorylase [Proteobacteria bacterium]|nr:purine-nucleoside phosphorylase [Pseudomonadota bacterium]
MQAVVKASDTIRRKLSFSKNGFPDTLVILGSGFKSFASKLKVISEIDLATISGFPLPKVQGHGSSLLIGRVGKKMVCVLTGRVHMYEGYSAAEVVFALRVLAELGVKRVILTNASGSLNKKIKPGNIVILEDQINLTGQSCLAGMPGKSPVFVDMGAAYDLKWRSEILKLNSKLISGVYVGVLGPAYESPAEAKMFAKMGGDIIGMSTVQETLAARQLGIQVAGISFVTNMSAGGGLSHADVLALARKNEDKLAGLIAQIISNLVFK